MTKGKPPPTPLPSGERGGEEINATGYESEGWAPGPGAVLYPAKQGVRCVATHGPALRWADPKRALYTYWTLAGSDTVAVEYLTRLDRLPDEPCFLFAALEVRGCRGGPGRATALC
jgi:kynurenine formamidase